jgi:hypothetical protein
VKWAFTPPPPEDGTVKALTLLQGISPLFPEPSMGAKRLKLSERRSAAASANHLRIDRGRPLHPPVRPRRASCAHRK